jgi:hypothetical protein
MGILEGCLDGGGGLKVPASVLTIKGNTKSERNFLTIYITRTGNRYQEQSNFDVTSFLLPLPLLEAIAT